MRKASQRNCKTKYTFIVLFEGYFRSHYRIYISNKLNILNQTRILSAQAKAFFNFTKCLRRYSKTDMRVSMSERAVWKAFSSKFWLRAPSAIVFVTTA